jgi:hypothetical protein
MQAKSRFFLPCLGLFDGDGVEVGVLVGVEVKDGVGVALAYGVGEVVGETEGVGEADTEGVGVGVSSAKAINPPPKIATANINEVAIFLIEFCLIMLIWVIFKKYFLVSTQAKGSIFSCG